MNNDTPEPTPDVPPSAEPSKTPVAAEIATPPASPPPLPQAAQANGPLKLSDIVEDLLKKPERLLRACLEGTLHVPLRLLFCLAVCFATFGLILGSFTGGVQLWAAPLKITGGILAAVVICLPSLYIFSALDGINARLSQIGFVLLAAVTLTGLLLMGFAPVLWVFSTSISSLNFMGFLALVFWAIGLYFGARLLLRAAGILGMRGQGYLKTWLVIFIVVTLQMSTSLRPIIGTADTLLPTEKKFFIQHWVENLGKENLAGR
ncbi:MAG TPA: hypothetical protein VGE29_08755 [Prosthecobacter sp.]